ncbi:hypothetical protein TIFTF001_007857 [Ficus carica]|uniref:Protein kinase domain-containing protein n=1 Tax=Ficus carica TaxID=3494 RepID=A0AA88D016_FICCA|nr:hypothetical protein TIFTF001_007857 [Ficus carica]
MVSYSVSPFVIMASRSLLVLFFLFSLLVLLSSAEEKKHHPVPCTPFPCGKLGNFSPPFRSNTKSDCGLYTVDCSESVPNLQLKEGGYWYEIDHISPYGDSISIKNGVPPQPFDPCKANENYALPSPSMISNLSTSNLLTIFNCSHSLDIRTTPSGFKLSTCGDDVIYYTLSNNSTSPFLPKCSMFQLPGYNLTPDSKISSLPVFTLDVRVSLDCYHCYRKEGLCRFSAIDHKFSCSETEENGLHDSKTGSKNLGVKLILGVLFGIVALILLFCCTWKFYFGSRLWKKQSPTQRNIEAFLQHHGPLQARRYSYLDVKKMTDSFKEKLGQGGFGSVYKGKLHDGCLVAVKVLDESKANGEDFINEVATISRTSHVNIVSLLGFCFEGAKRALVYEFMPNGSLEKFVFDENSTENSHQLDWDMYYQISLGIARGLEYLHRGCNTRILHFDIKPHNILLDADFMPKISDFGLARICSRKESLISMLGPRGTIGYIAPEVVCRSFGGISHKSDVYSYGMMVLEMVGGRKNVNIGAENTSEIYFPHWIYKRLELDEELRLKNITNEGDRVKVRQMIVVGLWCIQTNPSSRPAMSKVIEMLEGSLDSLQVPPKPFLYSPPRSPPADTISSLLLN